MVTQEQIDIVAQKFREGKRRDVIKESLVADGWKESEVDDTIAEIQHRALQQIPFIAKTTKFFSHLDKKAAELSPVKAALILMGFAAGLVLLTLGLNMLFDPLGSKAAERDTQRKADMSALTQALHTYYSKRQVYPNSLTQLAPTYIRSVPVDPKTHRAYGYKPIAGLNYQLCINFETLPADCFSPLKEAETIIPTILPTNIGTLTPISLTPKPTTASISR